MNREQERINAARQEEAVMQAKAQEALRIEQSKPRSGVPLGLTFDAFKKQNPSAHCVDPAFCVLGPATDVLFGEFTPTKEIFHLRNDKVIQVTAKFNEAGGWDVWKFIWANFPDNGHGNGETNQLFGCDSDHFTALSKSR